MFVSFVADIILLCKNSIKSFKKTVFFGSGHPFMGRFGVGIRSHFGTAFLTDVPGIFFPVSSCTHQQYPTLLQPRNHSSQKVHPTSYSLVTLHLLVPAIRGAFRHVHVLRSLLVQDGRPVGEAVGRVLVVPLVRVVPVDLRARRDGRAALEDCRDNNLPL